MKNKYIFPLQIFLILEKINSKIWFNKNLNSNNYYIFFSNKWAIVFFQIIANEVLLNKNVLIEHSSCDMIFSNNKSQKWLFYFFRHQIFYNIYFYFLKIRLIVFLANLKLSKNNTFYSAELFFKNANWLERESSEMYGIYFFNKKDARKLLLDYSKQENPMLKNFPSEGIVDVFYNFFFNQVITVKNEVVEL